MFRTMMLTRRFALLALAALLLGGAAVTVAFTSDTPPPDARISPAAAQAAQDAGELTLVDIRTPREWTETGIPAGAKTADFNALSEDAFIARIDRLLGRDRTQPVALVCARGGRSSRAWSLLVEAGFTQVLDVHEGMLGNDAGPGWLARDLPLEFR